MNDSNELDPLMVNPLQRPEARPRNTPMRSVRPRSRIAKIALALVAGTVVLALAGRLATAALEPMHATFSVGQEIKQLENVMKREQAATVQLHQDIAYLKTVAGVEEEARRRGWVRPGEVPLTIVPPETAVTAPGKVGGVPASQSTSPLAAPAPTPSMADRVRSAVDTSLAVLGGKSKQED